jgi:hypothetical protein
MCLLIICSLFLGTLVKEGEAIAIATTHQHEAQSHPVTPCIMAKARAKTFTHSITCQLVLALYEANSTIEHCEHTTLLFLRTGNIAMHVPSFEGT